MYIILLLLIIILVALIIYKNSNKLKFNSINIKNIPKFVHLIYIPWEKDGKTLKKNEWDFNTTFYEEFKEKNKDWNVILWNYSKLKNFMLENYPSYWKILINNYKLLTQIVDFCRLIIVYHYGGLYWQYESKQLTNLDNFIPQSNKKITLFIESILTNKQIENSKLEPIRKNKPEEKIRIANQCYYAFPKNEFLYLCIIKSIDNLQKLEVKKDYDILYIGANAMISEVYDEYKNKDKINLLKKNNYIKFSSHGSWRNKLYN